MIGGKRVATGGMIGGKRVATGGMIGGKRVMTLPLPQGLIGES
jgi:hypothetical protein